MRKHRNTLDLDAEFISPGLLKDKDIASQPWFLEFDMRSQGVANACNLDTGGFWQEIPVDLREHFQAGRGYIIMNMFLEGFTDYFFGAFYAYARKQENFPFGRIIYVSSALDIAEIYPQWCKENNIQEHEKITCWSTGAWEYALSHIYTTRSVNNPIKREKKFLFLNRRLRRHRVLFPCLFAEEDLYTDSLISYFPDDDLGHGVESIHNSICRMLADKPALLDKYRKGYEITAPNLPYIVDTTDNYFNHAVTMADGLYERTYFSVVSETFYFDDDTSTAVFPSEKTFKPMYQLHPFVLVGRPHFLKELRKVGYKTFSPWIDESYDDIEDDMQRAEAITKEVVRLAGLSDAEWIKMIAEMQEVLRHNQNAVRDIRRSFLNTDLRGLYDFAIDPFCVLSRNREFMSNVAELNPAFGPVLVYDAFNDPTIIDPAVKPHDGTDWLASLFRYDNVIHTYTKAEDLGSYPFPWFYPVEINAGQDLAEKSIWHRIPQSTRNKLVNSKGYLLLVNIHEGETTVLFDGVHRLLRDNPELHFEKIVLVSGAVNIEKLYQEYCEFHGIDKRVRVTYANLFYSRTRETWKGKHPLDDTKIKEGTLLTPYLDKRTRPRKFVCLNRVPKPHRVALVAALTDRGLLSKGIISCHLGPNKEQAEWAHWTLRKYSEMGLFSIKTAQYLTDRLPLVVDKTDPEEFVTYEFAEQLYFNTYFTVVTESFGFARPLKDNLATDISIFPTEKVYKPILMGHPFVVFAPPGFLKHIRDQGFDTFPELFNEGYDDIQDDLLRLRAIVNEVDRVSNMSDAELIGKIVKMKDKLARNQRVLMKENPPEAFLKLLADISHERL
jgi:hypothetical protein